MFGHCSALAINEKFNIPKARFVQLTNTSFTLLHQVSSEVLALNQLQKKLPKRRPNVSGGSASFSSVALKRKMRNLLISYKTVMAELVGIQLCQTHPHQVYCKNLCFTLPQMKFPMKNLFCKCEQVRSLWRICSNLLKKSFSFFVQCQ